MAKGSIQAGIERGKIQACPACGSKFVHVDPEEASSRLVCPRHPKISPTRFRVMFGNICHHHNNYEAAQTELHGFLHENMCGTFDERNYQIKAKTLSFTRLADEWLNLKSAQLRPGSMPPLRNAFKRGIEAWGDSNIRGIKFAQIEDLLSGLNLAPKTKKNMLDALKQFWSWVSDRYEIPPIKNWPKLLAPEMDFRKTVSIADQEAILTEVYNIATPTRIRSWIGIKWLCTYISIRPGEMRSLKEGNVDRQRGLLIFQHPKSDVPKLCRFLMKTENYWLHFPWPSRKCPFSGTK